MLLFRQANKRQRQVPARCGQCSSRTTQAHKTSERHIEIGFHFLLTSSVRVVENRPQLSTFVQLRLPAGRS